MTIVEIVEIVISFLIFGIIDYLIVKLEIKQNFDLFYALHYKKVERQIKKSSIQKNGD